MNTSTPNNRRLTRPGCDIRHDQTLSTANGGDPIMKKLILLLALGAAGAAALGGKDLRRYLRMRTM